MVLSKKAFFLLMALAVSISVTAQQLSQLYSRADSVKRFANMVYNLPNNVNSINNSNLFWYKINTPNGYRFFIVDATKQKKQLAFDTQKLLALVNTNNSKKTTINSLHSIDFNQVATEIYFTLNEHRYTVDIKKYIVKTKQKVDKPEHGHWAESQPDPTTQQTVSPDSCKVAYIKNYNIYVKNIKTNTETQLSTDGSQGEYYSSQISWSANSVFVVTCKVRAAAKRNMFFVESSPNNQLLPVLHTYEYLRPGDALPIKQPALFNVNSMLQIPVNVSNYLNQFDINNIEWHTSSAYFTFEFNQRGHQVYKIVKVDTNGITTDIVTEQFDTFFDYSGKRYRYDINSTGELIWASERDGYNHLYLFNKQTGKLINQITKGNWVVRGVEYVDTVNRQVIFSASGKNSNHDPYFIHYYRVGFNGQNLVELTPEPLNHHAVFNNNFTMFIDVYSSVNTPQVTVLRSATNGNVLMQLEQANISEILKNGYTMPEPFVAKGRDSKTDIWGNIYRPTNFDSLKSYPVVEYIYAGPQSAYVQKTFSPYTYSFSGLAELGFIVVTIDGMGTSCRSKAFHDVCYKNLKDAGFPDRILWIKAAANKYSYIDTTRVGIFGGSAGGQNSLAALLFYPGFYKVAVSSCGCHDNRVDKMWWNEQWMGFPIDNHYIECSNVVNAHKLQGQLMLIVGEIDDNVDPASTMQVASALIKANKNFELVVLPGVNHTLGGDFGERKRRDFFVEHLLGTNTPNWNNN